MRVPVLSLGNIAPTSKNTLFYEAVEEPAVGGRRVVVPAGGTLGGGSAINLSTYSRAQRTDLDAWATEGWAADDLLPLMRRAETYHGPGAPGLHGDAGPIHVSSTFRVPATEESFIATAAARGWSEAVDIQDLETGNAVQRNLRYNTLDGNRSDAAEAYLRPRLRDEKHPGLKVLVEHQVVRVLFDGTRASGVEVRPNPNFQEGASCRSITARRLVVVSCGAIGSPLVLERSGVGKPETLARAGVEVVADVQGVGEGYRDHHLHLHPYLSNLEPEQTVDALYTGRRDLGALIAAGDKILGWNVVDVVGKVRPSDADVAAMKPGARAVWDADYKDDPSRPLAIITLLSGFPGDPNTPPPGQYLSTTTFTTYPLSLGHVHITGPGVDDAPDFATGFLSDAAGADIEACAWAYKAQRELMRRMPAYRGELATGHPAFASSSGVACGPADGPVATDAADLVYTAEDDAVLATWLRETVGSTWHSMGTCRMAPREDRGVVDAALSVYGVQGLKVADLSIAPGNVGANTCNTALVIGEKAADIFIEELVGRKY